MPDKVFFADYDDVYIFKFVGNFHFSLCPAVEGFMRTVLIEKGMRPVVVDMTETTGVDSTGMGFLAQIALHSKRMLQVKPTLLVSDNDILKILKSMDFESVFNILLGGGSAGADFKEIKPIAAEEKEMTRHILAAHRTLMDMGPENKAKFEQAVKVFEKKQAKASRFESSKTQSTR
jgi:anti-anti-sigma regulatory factor